MDRPTCRTCPFWELRWNGTGDDCIEGELVPLDDPDRIDYEAECHRNAPVGFVAEIGTGPFQRPEIYSFVWPTTSGYDSCGEHPDFPAWIEHEKASRKVDRPPAACATPIRLQPTEKKHVDRAVIDRKGDFNPNCDCLPYLSLEAGDALWESNVTTWTQLANLTEDDLRAMKGFPVDSIREVADKLAERGLGLRDSLSR